MDRGSTPLISIIFGVIMLKKIESNAKMEKVQDIVSIIDEEIAMQEPAYYDGSWWDGLEHHDGDVYDRYEIRPIIKFLQNRVKCLEKENEYLKSNTTIDYKDAWFELLDRIRKLHDIAGDIEEEPAHSIYQALLDDVIPSVLHKQIISNAYSKE